MLRFSSIDMVEITAKRSNIRASKAVGSPDNHGIEVDDIFSFSNLPSPENFVKGRGGSERRTWGANGRLN